MIEDLPTWRPIASWTFCVESYDLVVIGAGVTQAVAATGYCVLLPKQSEKAVRKLAPHLPQRMPRADTARLTLAPDA